MKTLTNKRIMIIGGSGSLGTTLIRRLIDSNNILVYSRDESKHWALKNKFNNRNLAFTVGDIRDKQRLRQSILRYRPNIIIIAAALKHVDVCELAPSESIQTNIDGPKNVADIIEEEYLVCRLFVQSVLMVSTDKACSPINVYGMSKAIAERVVLEKARELSDIKFCAVRYGNVLESRGSIIPLFLYQAKNNIDLTITHPDMTRFLMTLDQSVDLILNCIMNAKSGELFVPRLPSMKIIDLANIFAEKYNVNVKLIGMRSGEKMHESMINPTESLKTLDMGKHFVIRPAYETTIHNDMPYDFNSELTCMTKQELCDYLTELGYLDRELTEFDDVTIDTIRKTSHEHIRSMTT
jgi:UDP-N-acetylglucosamine 4,6-dehydratase